MPAGVAGAAGAVAFTVRGCCFGSAFGSAKIAFSLVSTSPLAAAPVAAAASRAASAGASNKRASADAAGSAQPSSSPRSAARSTSLSSQWLIDAVKHLSFDDSFVCDSFLAHDSRPPSLPALCRRRSLTHSLSPLPRFEFILFTRHSLSASVALLFVFLVSRLKLTLIFNVYTRNGSQGFRGWRLSLFQGIVVEAVGGMS